MNNEPVAWMRKWAYDKETPVKVKNDKGKLAYPFKYKLMPVTIQQCLPDDVPLYDCAAPSNYKQQG